MTDDRKVCYQVVDDNNNPVGPVRSELAGQIVDDNGKPIGEVESGITYDVID